MGDTILDLKAIEVRCRAACCEVNHLCQRRRTTDITLTNSFRDIPTLVAEVKQLRMLLSQDGTAYLPCQHCHKNVAAPTLESVELCFDCWEQLCEAGTEVEWLRRELHDEQVRRDEWGKMYSQAAAGTEVEQLQERLGQVKIALNREMDSRVRAEREVERLQAELALNTKMLASQCDLAALMNGETADLLERLANCTLPNTFADPYAMYRCVKSREAARALAAKIGEVLEVDDGD